MPLCDGASIALLRYPVYAGELAMMLSDASTRLDTVNQILVGISIAATMLRIVAEEHFLIRTLVDYRQYTNEVRPRRIPRLW